MKKLISIVLTGLAVLSCSKTQEKEVLSIYYPEIVNIGPSMHFVSDPPSYAGVRPEEFSITQVTLDGSPLSEHPFSINAKNGSISLSETDNMALGLYSVSVRCLSQGRSYDFPDVFSLHMIPAIPSYAKPDENKVVKHLGELTPDEVLLKVNLEPNTVTVLKLSLVQTEERAWFSIDEEGNVRVPADKIPSVLPGDYPLSLKVSTYAGEKVFENIAVIRIVSAPLALSYTPDSGRAEYGTAFTSAVPQLLGSEDALVFALMDPELPVSINPATGVLSLSAGNQLEVGAHFDIGVRVSNEFGTKDFEHAFVLDIISYIAPIDAASFSYADKEIIQGGLLAWPLNDGFQGDEVQFALGELPSALEGQLSLDPVSGTISIQKGNSIPLGVWEIPVTATNAKGSVTTRARLSVVENHYYFTKILYGNNLGLPQDGSYASQYRVTDANDYAAMKLLPQTDVKAGVQLKWSLRILSQCAGTSINADNGELSFTTGGFKAANGGAVLVTAVAGEGTEGETKVSVPVFFSFLTAVNDVTIAYTPFVMQVNPRKGFRSASPVLTGVDAENLRLDWRRSFNYFNLNGPATHVNGQPNKDHPEYFMSMIWASYYRRDKPDAVINYGSKDPLSYYSNKTNLAAAISYIEAGSFQVVVNPNKWMDAEGNPANGIFIGQTTFVKDGDESKINTGSQVFPVWLWFDVKF